jgi:hypothetical protein
MSRRLPALRRGLDILPSPETSRPGLLLRDPLRYTDKVAFVPPPWTIGLRFLDGEHTELDMQEALTRAMGGVGLQRRGTAVRSGTARDTASANHTRQSLSATQVRQNLAGGLLAPRASGAH